MERLGVASELAYAIDNGAVGATCNPVIVLTVIRQELTTWMPAPGPTDQTTPGGDGGPNRLDAGGRGLKSPRPPDEEVPLQEFAVTQERSPYTSRRLLLDGQQRLTSLSAVIRGEPVSVGDRLKPIELLFNLEHPDEPEVVTEVNGGEGPPKCAPRRRTVATGGAEAADERRGRPAIPRRRTNREPVPPRQMSLAAGVRYED